MLNEGALSHGLGPELNKKEKASEYHIHLSPVL